MRTRGADNLPSSAKHVAEHNFGGSARVWRRCAIAFFFDPSGIFDDYMLYLLEDIRRHSSHTILVVNGCLTGISRLKAESVCDKLIERENLGFDVGAYKQALESIDYGAQSDFDEILLFNHTFYGPLYPFSEMFGSVERVHCDFWGITAHRAVPRNKDCDRDIPFHLNSHFIAVRRAVFASQIFRDYWNEMPVIESYNHSIMRHELVFTQHFQQAGFRCHSYVDPEKFFSDYSAFFDIDETVDARCPVLKRRAFFHDPMFTEERAVNLPRALDIIKKKSNYPTKLIWQNILRSTPARVLYANASMLRVLPSYADDSHQNANSQRVAVCVHAHYAEKIGEILDRCAYIPVIFDLIITTDSLEKKRYIEDSARLREGIGRVFVRILKKTRGRDMSSLFVTCGDLLTTDNYDIVCRLHTKKTPQGVASSGNYFRRYLLDSIIESRDYVSEIISLFARDESLGLIIPPMIHRSLPTMGHAWFVNRENVIRLAEELEIKSPIDSLSPLAAFGGMFWFRPQALHKLFGVFKYEDFENEPLPVDGTLAHALERILVYVAQDAGFYTLSVSNREQIQLAYTTLEYKADTLCSLMPTGDFREQANYLIRAAQGGFPQKQDDWLVSLQNNRRIDMEMASRGALLSHVENRISRIARPSLMQRAGMLSHKDLDFTRGYANKLKKEIPNQKATSRRLVIDYLFGSYLKGMEIFWWFDSKFYLETNRDVAESGENPLVHFLHFGWSERRAPHPLIELSYFESNLRRSGAINVSGLPTPMVSILQNPIVSPHPLFDVEFYSSQLGITAKEMHPVEHYLSTPSNALRNPHPLFDSQFYLNEYPDVAQAGINPLLHYMKYGWREGRKTSSRFDSFAYLLSNPDVATGNCNALEHYVRYGANENRTGGIQ